MQHEAHTRHLQSIARDLLQHCFAAFGKQMATSKYHAQQCDQVDSALASTSCGLAAIAVD
jgi:hypothetical protein